MIFCKGCGYEGAYFSKTCPVCKKEFALDEEELSLIKEDIEEAKRLKVSEAVTEGYHILADFGDTEGEREWAKILEKGGDGVEKSIDGAMEYYRRAAEKFDPYSALRYSDLLSRINDDAARFWLEFSAFIGSERAYADAARSLIKRGEDELGNHYLYLAAASDDTDAIVMLAERYFKGEGIEEAPEYAKWYMEKLAFPPLHAFKLAMKLRSVKAKEAPNIAVKDLERHINRLIGEGKRLKILSPVFYLTSLLFERGKSEVGADLADMHISGIGTKKNPEEGIRCLSRAAASGNARAYMSLGRIYYEGEHTERNLKFALECFERAASLGDFGAYELLGDIYHSESFPERDIARAAELYRKAADGGLESARKKLRSIVELREEYYKKAMYSEKSEPELSFKYYYIATAMGHPTSKLRLAMAYTLGNGTKRDPSLAFYYYKSAADEGCDEAYFPLGVCYARGFGTAFDFKEAIRCLSIADRLGEKDARKEIVRLCENKKRRLGEKLYSTAMRLIYSGKFEIAKEYLDVAARFSHPKAIYTLGCLHEFGRGTELNRDKAYELYGRAEEVGFNDARSSYKLTILKMIKKY